jgi:hypothetical protein
VHCAVACGPGGCLGSYIEVTLDDTFNQVEEKTLCRVVDSDNFTLKNVGEEFEVCSEPIPLFVLLEEP